MTRLFLPDAQATLALGAALGVALAAARGEGGGSMPLLLSGPLGSGKTTLVRGLVSTLPGAHAAEVSSPSFNIVNLYPTTPPVAHFDLYRVAGAAPDEFFDALDAKDVLVVAEWAENLPPGERPDEALLLAWTPVPSGRALEIRAWGKAAEALLDALAPKLNQWRKESSQ
ncbi:tRNA threonylcarbamoyladenosine biosynthesis protein TsaE [Humidesulfovibrio mexicanus]|uniref:tRNA threonylcarbamoyladenosine biosynthesis protein TsaE n=1 Tax=Humidesulfovibrio mexicanus TaxID=147047 RepID=A0A238Z7H3_9BACT|nr:tRNA (adenosine(37)-N6)-threonylcarbamoyltransferase complex ATPase subunit type 1 TsaE [Humidesulfovibrio mexicanus]SNR79092.1 tRNA threonylcarbamoyladenosine biosynthesis protein TsaE [Humidesulfovibrio mexicanus]